MIVGQRASIGRDRRTTSALVCRTLLTPPGRTKAGRHSDAWSDGQSDGYPDDKSDETQASCAPCLIHLISQQRMAARDATTRSS